MTNLYIPRLGDEITLTKDWTFFLRNERRNVTMFLGRGRHSWGDDDFTEGRALTQDSEPVQLKFYEIQRSMGVYSHESGKTTRMTATWTAEKEFGENFIKKEVIDPNTNLFMVTVSRLIPFPDRKETLEAGTILMVDRIYIRKTAKDSEGDYDSVTFIIKSGPKKGCRFWASLDDVNYIEFE